MDQLDLAILRLIQDEFPLSTRPYAKLAATLGATEEEVYQRTSALLRSGVIRRVGPLFSSRKLGLRGHLVAAEVEPHAIDAVVAILAERDEVTHNYLRDGRLNVWFTVMLSPEDPIDKFLAEFTDCAGVSSVHVLPSAKMFKLDASFNLGDNDG